MLKGEGNPTYAIQFIDFLTSAVIYSRISFFLIKPPEQEMKKQGLFNLIFPLSLGVPLNFNL